jgi:hypothetical protein
MNQSAAHMTTEPPQKLSPPMLAGYLVTDHDERLGRLFWAAHEVHECHRVLHRAQLNLVTEILRESAAQPVQMAHYPENDVEDPDSHALYFYHSHRTDDEHGHFHCFVHITEFGQQKPVHIGAISMDAHGLPIALFATNQWVTGEHWLPAEQTIGLIDRFVIDHAAPSWPTNRWISAMFVLFRPHFEQLLRHRDTTLAKWQKMHPNESVHDDERIDVTGVIPLDVGGWMREIEAELRADA